MLKEYCFFNAVNVGANATHFSAEFLDTTELSGLPPYKPELETRSPIILIRNLDLPRFCNGTWMITEEFHKYHVIAKVKISAFKSDIVTIPRITLNLSEGEDAILQPCFALTIHKM